MHPVTDTVDRDRGSIMVVTILVLVPMLVVSALAIDLGHAYFVQPRSQAAADAGSLAGAAAIADGASAARAKAAELAFNNLGVTVVPTGVACGADPTNTRCYTSGALTVETATPYCGSAAPPAEAIHVSVCEGFKTSTGSIVLKNITVCADAVARRVGGSGPGGGCGLCILNPSGTTLSSTGAGTLTVNNGAIAVNSSASGAGSITGAGTISSTGAGAAITFVGGYSQPSPGQFSPTPSTGATPISDPLASLAVPSVGLPILGSPSVSGSSSITLSPGIYDKITSSSTGQITLNPGIYVIRQSITLNKSPAAGSVSLKGDNVLIYFACSAYPTPCSTGQSGGKLTSTGGATVQLAGRTSADPTYQGMVIFSDRNNTGTIGLTGSSGSSFSGTVYAKSGQVSLTGPSGVFSLQSVIVAGSVIKTGDSAMSLDINLSVNSPAFISAGSISLVG